VKEWFALFEARWRRWYGVSRRDRWAILGGQLVVPIKQSRPPYWVWNSGLHQLYMSSYHLSPDAIGAYWEAMRRYRVIYVLGYASSLYSLALGAIEQGLQSIQPKVVISNAEPLFQHQRELIAEAFSAPVRDTYGQSENVCAASECEAGRMHLWPEVGVYEVFQDEEAAPAPPGLPGRLICTGLLNPDMPLIRYEVGDRVSIAGDEPNCLCGRCLPILNSVEGRQDDVLLTREGRRIGRLDPIFKTDLPIREAQIIQEDYDRFCVKYVPSPGFTPQDGAILVSRLKDRVGEVQVSMEEVGAIPRQANGKFRAVISKIA
jgi:phenylacetate-CoA ligase